MYDFFEEHGIISEARVSLVLNVFMYVDDCIDIEKYKLKNQGKLPTLKEVVRLLETNTASDFTQGQYDGAEWGNKPRNEGNIAALTILKEYLERDENRDIANLEVVSFSNQMGADYIGAYAATFRSANDADTYVVFRGTGAGRWQDNGTGLSAVSSPYQDTALAYFNMMMASGEIPEDTNLVVTGHSKGGNIAQYVTLTADEKESIDKCLSFDGQGFSPEFIESLGLSGELAAIMNYEDAATVAELLAADVLAQTDKMYSICGDNDYVNVLGIKVISSDHTVYIHKNYDDNMFNLSHALVTDSCEKLEDTKNNSIFNFDLNLFYPNTGYRDVLSRVAGAASQMIMKLSQVQRVTTCETLMSIFESMFNNGRNGGTGLNGENVADFERLGKGIMLSLLYGMGSSTSLSTRQKSIEYLCDSGVFYFIGLMSSLPYIEHAAFKECVGLSLDEFFEKRADEWYHETFDTIYEYGTSGNDVMNFKDATNPMIIYGRSGDDEITGAMYKVNMTKREML